MSSARLERVLGQLSASPLSTEETSSSLDSFEHGGDLVGEALKAHNVPFVFTLIGGHISPILVGAQKRGIRIIDVRHEVNAVFAADAVSRLSDTVGVAAVTAGPGLTNTITAVKNAAMAQSPLILLGGATASLLKGRGSLQDIDQQALFEPHVKWQASVQCVQDIIPTLCKAFHVARSGIPGPVFLEFTLDVLYPEAAIRSEALKKIRDDSLKNKVVRWYISRHLNKVYNRTNMSAPTTREASFPKATDREISAAVQMLAASKRPVIVVGSQSVAYAEKAQSVRSAVEKLGLPTYLSGMARGLLGPSCELQMRHSRGVALKEADLVILLGVPFDFRLGYGQSFSSSTPVIAVNKDREQLYKNRSPTLAIAAESADFVVRLSELASAQGVAQAGQRGEWLHRLRSRDAQRDHEILRMGAEPSEPYCNPLGVCLELDRQMDAKSIIVADGGDFVATASYILHPRGPLTWLDPGPFGTLGVGAGFALGAKLVRPDHEVWLLWGDGSAGYSLMEYDTFVRHNVPVISVIGNDACWSQIYRDQVETFKTDVGCMLAYNNYHEMSAALGAKGHVVRTIADLPASLREAKADAAERHSPSLVNVLISKTDFRKGSISV